MAEETERTVQVSELVKGDWFRFTQSPPEEIYIVTSIRPMTDTWTKVRCKAPPGWEGPRRYVVHELLPRRRVVLLKRGCRHER